MTTASSAIHVGQLLRRCPTKETRPDGFPAAIHYLFAVHPDGEDSMPYPVSMTVETATAETSSGPVLDALEADARRRLASMFAVSMSLDLDSA